MAAIVVRRSNFHSRNTENGHPYLSFDVKETIHLTNPLQMLKPIKTLWKLPDLLPIDITVLPI